MSNESTIHDLKVAIREVEVKKRQIDEDHRALVATLRYFERQESGTQQPPQHTDSPSPSNELRTAIHEILSAEGPLHRSDIYRRLTEKGVDVPGRDPINNIGAHLSFDDRFNSVVRGVWGLANASDYEPDTGVENESNEELDVPW